jgi:uncharacterized protein (DUF433 family)
MVRTLTTHETDALIARHVGPHPSNPGIDEYWLKEPGIPVWAIIGSMIVNDNNTDDVAAMYHISHEEVEAAWAYYLQHRGAIDHRLEQNRYE